jgi:hypothetical protein
MVPSACKAAPRHPTGAQSTSAANPSGIFPGPGTLTPGTSTYTPGPGAVAASSTDNDLTSGLRNTVGVGQTALPALGTITGIMTDPQFRVAINAIEQRTGSDLLAAPKVTTESGRQAHMAAQDLVYIVTQASVTESTSAVGGLTGGTGVAAPSVNYTTSFMASGAEPGRDPDCFRRRLFHRNGAAADLSRIPSI